MKPLKLGLLGAGVVGQAVAAQLLNSDAVVAQRSRRPLQLARVATRSLDKVSQWPISSGNDVLALVRDPEIEVVIELMGGVDQAYEAVKQALLCGKHVVSANKALLAHHGDELLALADERGLVLGFEAAVAGGVPVIKAIREGLVANRISRIAGIVNGTSNFILSAMGSAGHSFAAALAEAQRLGYAEADPSLDVNGMDAAHKLVLLAHLAFGCPCQLANVWVRGIENISAVDFLQASRFGHTIKLVALAQVQQGQVILSVRPSLVPQDSLLAHINGVSNVVMVQADATATTFYAGPGAGGQATASAVLADVYDIASGCVSSPLKLAAPAMGLHPLARQRFYVRLDALDQPGVLAAIASTLASQDISIEALQQQQPEQEGSWVGISLLTNVATQAAMDKAMVQLSQLSSVHPSITCLALFELER